MRGTLKSFQAALTWWILHQSHGKILTLGARTAAISQFALKENSTRLFLFAWRGHCAIDERNTCRFIDRNDLR